MKLRKSSKCLIIGEQKLINNAKSSWLQEYVWIPASESFIISHLKLELKSLASHKLIRLLCRAVIYSKTKPASECWLKCHWLFGTRRQWETFKSRLPFIKQMNKTAKCWTNLPGASVWRGLTPHQSKPKLCMSMDRSHLRRNKQINKQTTNLLFLETEINLYLTNSDIQWQRRQSDDGWTNYYAIFGWKSIHHKV